MVFLHKNIRRPAAHYQGQRWYFITFCCVARRNVFANARNAEWLVDHLHRKSDSHHFAVHAFCLMPDHVHVLVHGLETTSSLLVFLKNLKQVTGCEYQKEFSSTLWEKKFYDYILRPKDSPERFAAYIWMNSVRKGLCTNPLQYPYSGSFTFDWTKVIPAADSREPPWKTKGNRPA
jgi:REP element-mobilizing transposase RayT